MKVKIGDKVYDAKDMPIAIILEGNDKENINNMHEKANIYCSFPDNVDPKVIGDWLKKEIVVYQGKTINPR